MPSSSFRIEPLPGYAPTIGRLVGIAVVERAYHILTFEERRATPLELAAFEPALTLGAEGRRLLRDKPLTHYLHELGEARRLTLEGLAARDDDWLERPLLAAPR
jgi:hypothetical protein